MLGILWIITWKQGKHDSSLQISLKNLCRTAHFKSNASAEQWKFCTHALNVEGKQQNKTNVLFSALPLFLTFRTIKLQGKGNSSHTADVLSGQECTVIVQAISEVAVMETLEELLPEKWHSFNVFCVLYILCIF